MRFNTIAARAFLYSFVPVCVVLIASFVALNSLIETRVKETARTVVEKTEELIVTSNEEASRRVAQFMTMMAQSAGLKATLGLLQEVPSSQAAQVRSTIEAQLLEMHDLAGDDLLAVRDWKGRTVAAIGGDGKPREFFSFAEDSTLIESGGELYLLSTAPISLDGSEIGTLGIGRKFDLDRYHIGGDMVLLKSGRVLRSTLPHDAWSSLEQQIARKCGDLTKDCEIQHAGETFLVFPVHEPGLGNDYRLLALRSLDVATHRMTAGWLGIAVKVGAAGVMLALLFALVTARSVSLPLRQFVAQLQHGERTHQFPEQISSVRAAGELNLLAETFNRVAAAERKSRVELEKAKDSAEAANQI